MEIRKHLDKENLHHAYLIEGERETFGGEVLAFITECGVGPSSPDLCHIVIDNFKIEDARNLKDMSRERGIEGKKFFIISANHFALEAQNTMLKMFEEPIEDTHFFLITPDVGALIPTLVSRFYFIPAQRSLGGVGSAGEKAEDLSDAEKFVALAPAKRIEFLKDLLVAPDEDEISEDGVRAKALRFLNSLEVVLHEKLARQRLAVSEVKVFEQIFKARTYLRQPGASPKTLLESVALLIQ